MAKVSLNSHPEYVSQALKRYRVAPAMAKPRPGAGKVCQRVRLSPGIHHLVKNCAVAAETELKV